MIKREQFSHNKEKQEKSDKILKRNGNNIINEKQKTFKVIKSN